MKKLLLVPCLVTLFSVYAQAQDSVKVYKKRVLESTELDILTSYYSQDGDNAAVTGGRGTEKLSDFTPTVIVSIPLNDDDVLTVDAGISAYSSASSSNINPFDGAQKADAFQASSGASSSDIWWNFSGTYSHSSDDRNKIWAANMSVAAEYDYLSVGFGGSYARLFNEKNTELGIKVNVYLDTWSAIYPIELRYFATDGEGLNADLFTQKTITGKTDYNPSFEKFANEGRNSYSMGLSFSQILNKDLQGAISLDLVRQQGLLSTPFQRVYFGDIEDSFIDNFQLADDIERLPDSRFKAAAGGRLNYYINQTFVLRTYYRYYIDDWGINSNTLSVEIPVKISDKFTLYPSYRLYTQSSADYFAPYEQHQSTAGYYTSDYDLSEFNSNQYSLGITYTDIFTNFHLWKFGLKSVDLKYMYYNRNIGFSANMISGGLKFLME